MQCNAMQCNAMQCNAMQCNAMQCNAMQCNAMQSMYHTYGVSWTNVTHIGSQYLIGIALYLTSNSNGNAMDPQLAIHPVVSPMYVGRRMAEFMNQNDVHRLSPFICYDCFLMTR
jgi:hypothetical protein